MGEILAAGGPGYLIPAVLFVLVLYSVRGVFGLHGRRSQHRKEFLELWSDDRRHDDLWLEVAIRHLFGTYLPAPIIRLAMTQPDKSQALLDLSELWALLHFDSDTQTVRWLRKRHQTLQRRKAGRIALLVGYFFWALIALIAAWIASKSGPATFAGWLYGVCAVITGFVAFISLMREDSMKVAVTVGDDWMARINGLSI
jgi:hypothetical protein